MENPAVYAFSNFQEAVQAVLVALHDRVGFQLWMFTRVEGDDWIVLEACDRGYGVKTGDVFCWSDSFCSRMVRGLGPTMAPQSHCVPAYVEAPIGRQVAIEAYIGFPIYHRDGKLFGTLCAIDPAPQSDTILQEAPFIELQTRLLSTILYYELKAQEIARRYERAEAEATLDSLTGAYNRRGWDRLLVAEEARCQHFGHSAGVIAIDLDNLKAVNDSQGHAAGDRLLQAAAHCLTNNLRSQDILARIGGDEFAVLAIEATGEMTQEICARLQQQMEKNGLSASMGWAARSPQSTLFQAAIEADLQMYRQKNLRRQPNERS